MSEIGPLDELSGYRELLTYYNENKDQPWNEWLEFDSTFEKPGKQGLVGLLRARNDDKCKHKYVFKLSQYINHLVQHEGIVMRRLNRISRFCPHFCKSVGQIQCDVNPKCRRSGNPFHVGEKDLKIQKEVLLCEYLEKSSKLYNYIRAQKEVPDQVLFSTIKQVLLATIIAQRKERFTHYDLHSNNIMMRKCNPKAVFLYVIDKENQFCVPTLGYYPVIIDFGFSYVGGMDDGPLWPSMGHTSVGFMSDRFDWVADPKLFLVTVSGELKEKRRNTATKKLRRIVRNIFAPLTIDWSSGWDTSNEKSAADYVTEMLEDYNVGSRLFEVYDHHCVDLVQSLVVLPLESQSYKEIHVAYTTFLTEWVKIESQISSDFYNLYILKGLVDAAREVRPEYTRAGRSRQKAVTDFRRRLFGRVDSVVKFCRPKKVDFEKLLCGVLVLAKCIEGILYDVTLTQMTEKTLEYNRLPLCSTEQIYGAIEANFQDEFVYDEETTVFIMNAHEESCDLYRPPAEKLVTINALHPMARGTFIYSLYTSS